MYDKNKTSGDCFHADTTSVSLTGAYEHCEAEEYEGLPICHGYSKDHRPDLKPVIVGQTVTEHGIPLVSQALDGNTADSEFNHQALTLLSKTFELGLNRNQLINPTAEAILYMLRLYHSVQEKDTAWCACSDEEELARFNFWMDLLEIELGNT